MTRAGSLRRLALFGVWTAVGVGAFYVPTLAGGSPWSWHVAELDVRILMGLAALGGALWAHWFWPTTDRWPELERYCAALITRWEAGGLPATAETWKLRELVRPHVLERARRGR